MTYTPRDDGPIRVRFDTDNRQFIVERRDIRRRNGAVFPNDINDIPVTGQQIWTKVAVTTSLFESVLRCVYYMLVENRALIEVDLGPITPTNPVTVAAIQELQEIRL